MPELPVLSGKKLISLLTKHFGFLVVSQKGSHIKLQRKLGKRVITTIVPNHRELARGTLRGVLELAQVNVEEFLEVA